MKKKKKKGERKWTQEDFVESLDKVMKQQEEEDPKFKRVHARFEPEWKTATQLIRQLFKAGDEKEETVVIEKIASLGEKMIYPLIEVLLVFKKVQSRKNFLLRR